VYEHFQSPLFKKFGTLAFIRYPPKHESDLAVSFFHFEIQLILSFLSAFLFTSIMILKFWKPFEKESKKLSMQARFLCSCFMIYRIMLKEPYFNLKHIINGRLAGAQVIGSILIYYLLLNIIIEQVSYSFWVFFAKRWKDISK
jgi:hypothetical protein